VFDETLHSACTGFLLLFGGKVERTVVTYPDIITSVLIYFISGAALRIRHAVAGNKFIYGMHPKKNFRINQ